MSSEKQDDSHVSTSGYDYGPLQTYEVTWTSGHVEKIRCHQVSYSGGGAGLDALGIVGLRTEQGDRRVHLHGMINRRWLLVLSAREADIAALRMVTNGEEFAGERFNLGESGGEVA